MILQTAKQSISRSNNLINYILIYTMLWLRGRFSASCPEGPALAATKRPSFRVACSASAC